MQIELDLGEPKPRRDEVPTASSDAASQPADAADEESPWLEVQLEELQVALRGMRKLARAKEKAEAVVSYSDGRATIELPAVAVSASAEVCGPGRRASRRRSWRDWRAPSPP